MRFANRSAHDRGPELFRRVFNNQARREIANDGLTAGRPDRPHSDSAKREHRGEMAGNRVRIRLHTADRIVAGSWQGLPRRQVAYPRARYTIKKDAIGTDELERIPFDGIVAGGQDDAAGGP